MLRDHTAKISDWRCVSTNKPSELDYETRLFEIPERSRKWPETGLCESGLNVEVIVTYQFAQF